jgi:tetratricopeptide (TPR) repeat protein
MSQDNWLRWCLVIVFLLTFQHAWADSWWDPTTINVKSPSGSWEATVTPAKDFKSKPFSELVISDSLAAQKMSTKDMASWATAMVHSEKGKPYTFALRSPWMPVVVLLLDDGTLVTFDQWHSVGYGEVCIAYSPSGEMRWSRTLEDLVGKDIGDFPHTFSSINWRSSPFVWSLEPGGAALLIRLYNENQVRIRLTDGEATTIQVSDIPDDPRRLYNRAAALTRLITHGKMVAPLGTKPILVEPNSKQKEAIELLQRAVQLNPEDPELDYSIHDRLIQIFQSLEKHEQAIEVGKSALKRLIGRNLRGAFLANLYMHIADIQKEMGLMEEAEQNLKSAVYAAPGDYAPPNMEFARLLHKLGRPNEADAVFRKLISNGPDSNYNLLQSVGDFYIEVKQPATALDYYLMGYHPGSVTDPYLYLTIARTYENLREPSKALVVYQQLVEYYKTSGVKDNFGVQLKAALLQKTLEPMEDSH